MKLEKRDLEALVVAAYVFADEYRVPARGGRKPLVRDAGLVALAVAQAAIGISSDRQFLGLIGRVLPGWFPHLPDQSQYNRRLRALVGLISIVQQRLARWLDAGGARLSDGTLIGVANYPGCQQRSEFAGFARFGFAKSQHRFVYGVRLVLLTDERGLPLGYTIVPANEKEYEPLADLLTGSPAAVIVADKGFWGRDYAQRLAASGTTLLTPDKTRNEHNQRRQHRLASTRLVIESVFSNLKEQMRLEHHLARTPAGLALRIAQRILALTLGMVLNTLSGRPARALAAYDGRWITYQASSSSLCAWRRSPASVACATADGWMVATAAAVSLRVAARGRDCCGLGEEVKQFADFVALLGWVAHLGFLVDQVAVAPAVSFALEESGFGEFDHDPLGCSFGDADRLGDVAEPDVGIVGDAKQHLGVVCEKRPVGCSIA